MIKVFDLEDAVSFPSLKPAVFKPLSAEERVREKLAPFNERWDQAWAGYVAATRRADVSASEAEALTEIAAAETKIARQRLILARLSGTEPWDGIPTVSEN